MNSGTDYNLSQKTPISWVTSIKLDVEGIHNVNPIPSFTTPFFDPSIHTSSSLIRMLSQ